MGRAARCSPAMSLKGQNVGACQHDFHRTLSTLGSICTHCLSRPNHKHPTVTRSSLPVETMEPVKHRQDERIICLAARITTQSLSWLYADSTTPPLPPPQPPPPAAALAAMMTVPAVPLVPSRLGKPRRGLTVAGASGTRRAGGMRCSRDPADGRYPTFCHQPQVVE